MNLSYMRNANCVTQVLKNKTVVVYDLKRPHLHFPIDGLAAKAWLQIDQGLSFEKIHQNLTSRHKAPPRILKQELLKFFKGLQHHGLIQLWID